MFGKRIALFRLFGFQVRLDISWIFLAVLITWSLARGLFPFYYEGLSSATYWWMGAAGAAGLFVSIVFHEFFHSVIARKRGLPMKGITLFIFGGVAEMSDEPRNPGTEFSMAIAGPLSSIVLGILLYGIYMAGKSWGWIMPVQGVINYLAIINLVLAGFNLLPAFPLDGGRVLRSALWRWKGDIRWATRISSSIGGAFGIALIVIGIMSILTGNLIGGIWWLLIGVFMRNASQMSYQQVLSRKALEGSKVERFMERDPVTVPPSVTIENLVENFVYKYHFKMFPVANNGRLSGCITTKDIKNIPRPEWSGTRVGEIVKTCAANNTISPNADAVEAMKIMNSTGNSRLLVIEEDRLVGIITLKDILRFLAVKLDLEEN